MRTKYYKKFKLAALSAGLAMAFTPAINAQEVLLMQESFETDGQGTRYQVFGGGDNGASSVFARRRVGTPGTIAEGGTLNGEWMWAGVDIGDAPGPRGGSFEGQNMLDVQGRLLFTGINTANKGNFRIQLAAATGLGMPEPSDDMYIRVRFDGGEWVEIGGFKSASSNMRPAYYVGPKETLVTSDNNNKLFRFFSEWSWDIYGRGSVMDIDITIASNFDNDDHFYDNIRVYGREGVGFFDASFANSHVTEPVTGSIDNALSLSLQSAVPEGGVTVTFDGTFEAMSSLEFPGETVHIPGGATSFQVPLKVRQDGRYTGNKTFDLVVKIPGYNSEIVRLRVDNSSPFPDRLVIMEAMNVVPGTQAEHLFGDANGDGVYHNAMDTFIEIVNFENYALDLSGYAIGDDLSDRHLIPEGTILQPNTALVVFGGMMNGTRPRGAFGGAIVQLATAGGNGLGYNVTSRAERTYITAPFGALVDLVHMPLLRADILAITNDLPEGHLGKGVSASVHRISNVKGDVGFVLNSDHIHSIIPGSEQRLFSPGSDYNGQPYFTPENQITLTFAHNVISENAGQNATTGTIQLSSPAPAGGLEVYLDTDGVEFIGDDSFGPDEIDLDSLYVVVPAGQSSATFRIGAHADGILDGDRVVAIFARAGAYVVPGFAELVVEDADDLGDLNVVINEVLADVDGTAADFNLDGQFEDPLGDQFVEIVNNTDRPISMRGWSLKWDSGNVYALVNDVHDFQGGTILPPGGALVVFGRVSDQAAMDATFGGAIVQGAREADGNIKNDGLGLVTSTTFTLQLRNEHGYPVHEVLINSTLASQDQSLTRSPDITGEMALHLDEHLAAGGFLFLTASPGLMLTGDPFMGSGVVAISRYFTGIDVGYASGWYRDTTFGWVATGMALSFDMPWVYMYEHEGFWYVPTTASPSDLWFYDVEASGWFYTNYTFYPWIWKASSNTWSWAFAE